MIVLTSTSGSRVLVAEQQISTVTEYSVDQLPAGVVKKVHAKEPGCIIYLVNDSVIIVAETVRDIMEKLEMWEE